MPTSTIGTAQDHADPAAWESATDNDLVAAADGERGEMIDETFAGGLLNLAGATVNATYYRTLAAQAGAFYDAVAGSGALISSASTFCFVRCTEGFSRFYNFGVRSSASSATVDNQSSDPCIWDGLFAEWGGSNADSSGACFNPTTVDGSQLYNCIAWASHATGGPGNLYRFIATPNIDALNCAGYSASSATTRGINGNHASTTGVAENCVMAIPSGNLAYSLGAATVTANNNASSDASADDEGGSGHQLNVVATTIWTDPDNGDFTPVSGEALEDNGLDQSGTFTVDIIGNTHGSSGTWEIGAYDLAAAGGGIASVLAGSAIPRTRRAGRM